MIYIHDKGGAPNNRMRAFTSQHYPDDKKIITELESFFSQAISLTWGKTAFPPIHSGMTDLHLAS